MDKGWLREALKRRGRGSNKELADFLGVHPSTISKILAKRKITAEEGEKMKAFFSESETIGSSAKSSPHNAVITRLSHVRRDDTERQPVVMYRTVRGDTGTGGAGAFVLVAKSSGELPRDHSVLHSEKAFACRVLDASNAPAFEAGDVILVNPDMGVIEGNWCIFTSDLNGDEGAPALIARLVSVDDSHWIVKQVTQRVEQRLPRKQWPAAWPIVIRYLRT